MDLSKEGVGDFSEERDELFTEVKRDCWHAIAAMKKLQVQAREFVAAEDGKDGG